MCIFKNVNYSFRLHVMLEMAYISCYMIWNQMVKDSSCPWSRWTSVSLNRQDLTLTAQPHENITITPPKSSERRRNTVKEHAVFLLTAWTLMFMDCNKSSVLVSTFNREWMFIKIYFQRIICLTFMAKTTGNIGCWLLQNVFRKVISRKAVYTPIIVGKVADNEWSYKSQ